jgi:hypothetical protein
MPVKKTQDGGTLSKILGGTGKQEPPPSPALERERKNGRKVGKRSSGEHTLMGVYVQTDVKIEFEIACKRKRLEYSEVVERLLKGYIDGRFNV